MDQSYLSSLLQVINKHSVRIHRNSSNLGSSSAEHGPNRLHVRVFNHLICEEAEGVIHFRSLQKGMSAPFVFCSFFPSGEAIVYGPAGPAQHACAV